MKNQKCPCCKKYFRRLTRHHVYPKRIFQHSTEIVFVCRNCHNIIEETLRQVEAKVLRANPQIYKQVIWSFTK